LRNFTKFALVMRGEFFFMQSLKAADLRGFRGFWTV
jgi:hypothetical protein